MSKIPCKKCRSCGIYHDFTVEVCGDCQADIKNLPATLMETDEIPGEQYGDINEDITVYVQKCSACGALNFISDPEAPVKVCCNCHKTRVAAITPVLYEEEAAEPQEEEEAPVKVNTQSSGTATVLFGAADDDEDDDDDDAAGWQGILGNIKKTVSENGTATEPSTPVSIPEPTPTPVPTPPPAPIVTDDDDDDDDDDASDWAGILGGSAPKSAPVKPVAAANPNITLSAIRYGSYTFTLSPEPNQDVMLGRSANHSTFLSSDSRVSNNHCALTFKNGNWYVKDNHSTNGTAVNSIDIGLNGESILRDGDTLKLGHHPDSMEFSIKIGK